ncbi:MAG: xanthine dehydrogenase family protein subunit M [Spirochaetaceae bacterium]|nr:MAG: xanthine dehydrogenase family protein subunit M [Spirochaetaceae bacterium]
MHCFQYARPQTVSEAVELLATHGSDARILAGGTDLVIALRGGQARPKVVIDLKRISELDPAVRLNGDSLRISATTVMTDVEESADVQHHFPALAEAAGFIGSVQIRNRATVVGNICNASPAADTAPPLLVYGASLQAIGPSGVRTIALDDFFVRSKVTTLQPQELVLGIDVPLPVLNLGSAYTRLTRRRGTDLASVTLCVGVDQKGVTRLSYGSVGPRPVLAVDKSGVLADPKASEEAKMEVLARLLAGASPSPRSMRAGPDYRLAMLPVLGYRAVQKAIERLSEGILI